MSEVSVTDLDAFWKRPNTGNYYRQDASISLSMQLSFIAFRKKKKIGVKNIISNPVQISTEKNSTKTTLGFSFSHFESIMNWRGYFLPSGRTHNGQNCSTRCRSDISNRFSVSSRHSEPPLSVPSLINDHHLPRRGNCVLSSYSWRVFVAQSEGVTLWLRTRSHLHRR